MIRGHIIILTWNWRILWVYGNHWQYIENQDEYQNVKRYEPQNLHLTLPPTVHRSTSHSFADSSHEIQRIHLLHQHSADKFIYSYPLVQYKMINSAPMVIGINDGAEVLKQVYDKYEEIKLGRKFMRLLKGHFYKKWRVRLSDKIILMSSQLHGLRWTGKLYEILWLEGCGERLDFLRKTLTGNLLSMSNPSITGFRIK